MPCPPGGPGNSSVARCGSLPLVPVVPAAVVLAEGAAVELVLGVAVSAPPDGLVLVDADDDDDVTDVDVFVDADNVSVGDVSPSWVTMMTVRTERYECWCHIDMTTYHSTGDNLSVVQRQCPMALFAIGH